MFGSMTMFANCQVFLSLVRTGEVLVKMRIIKPSQIQSTSFMSLGWGSQVPQSGLGTRD